MDKNKHRQLDNSLIDVFTHKLSLHLEGLEYETLKKYWIKLYEEQNYGTPDATVPAKEGLH